MTKSRTIVRAGWLLACGLLACAPVARAQQFIGLSDEIIFISKAKNKQQQSRQQSNLGAAPGAGESPFVHEPGGRGMGLEQHANPAKSTLHYRGGAGGSALASMSAPGPQIVRSAAPLGAARRQPKAEELPPLYGPLELPAGDIEGPPDGLTLEQAIERLVRYNPDLRAKSYEIPQARADIITAGLRGNPFYFLSAGNYPYAPYSPARPGGNSYSTTIVQPFDVNHKWAARVDAQRAALNVLEAQYQDAVRLAIADLYIAFVDVMVAREMIRYGEASLIGTTRLLEAAEVQLRVRDILDTDYLAISIQHETARIGLDRAHAQFLQAKHTLAAMLAFPPDVAAQLEIRGVIRDRASPPPSRDELVQTALAVRPDLAAFRLGIARARADLRVYRKEVFEDIFFVYSPWQLQNNHPIGGQNATSYSFGVLGTIPLFNRNQGDIRRAQSNVVQTRVAWQALQRQAIAEVDRALLDYQTSRESLERLEQRVLPASQRMRQGVIKQFHAGDKSRLDVLEAQRQHNELIRQYRDTAIAHRRSMLRLNTVVGQRIMP
jgi:cobalt-zinc-cadmium efflux system outer membrane protein